MTLNIRTFVAPGFGENAYIAWRAGAAACIDPGNSVAAMERFLAGDGLTVEAILLTHAHLDHVEGVAAMARATGAPIHLHPADRPLYDRVAQQAQQFGLQVQVPPPPDHELHHGQRLVVGGVTYDVRHVPGHSPGHVLLHVADAAVAFVGDVVFQGSIGRTDLPGGDYAQLMSSIREHVLTLPDGTELYPGHGPPTTVDHERVTNPFLIPHYGGGIA
jgi:hydroxyacylglutathione hydrolase